MSLPVYRYFEDLKTDVCDEWSIDPGKLFSVLYDLYGVGNDDIAVMMDDLLADMFSVLIEDSGLVNPSKVSYSAVIPLSEPEMRQQGVIAHLNEERRALVENSGLDAEGKAALEEHLARVMRLETKTANLLLERAYLSHFMHLIGRNRKLADEVSMHAAEEARLADTIEHLTGAHFSSNPATTELRHLVQDAGEGYVMLPADEFDACCDAIDARFAKQRDNLEDTREQLARTKALL